MGGRSADSSPACARPGVHWGRNGRPSTVSVVRIAGAPRRAVHGAKEQCGGALHPPKSSVRVGTLPADGSQPRLPPDESLQDGARGVDDRRAVESRYDREGLVLVLVRTSSTTQRSKSDKHPRQQDDDDPYKRPVRSASWACPCRQSDDHHRSHKNDEDQSHHIERLPAHTNETYV